MFYLRLLLYRFYSNCDLTECNFSVVLAISCYMYINIHICCICDFSTDYYFPYVENHIKITL